MRTTHTKKVIAVFFLLIFSAQLLIPVSAYGLTTGPSQPEMSKFEPAGTTDLVDLFSGDMKYNIPLMDVGGYPINLSYQSGAGIEEEASWVGTGWSLNPGAVNRSMRGIPDDFNGDEVKKTFHTKPMKKVGGAFNVKATLFGWEKGKAQVELGIYKDNYYGIGASVGAGVSFQLSVNTKTSLNAGLNLLSDTRGGVDISPNVGIETQASFLREVNGAGLSGGFKYNTREGLKSMSLSASFNPSNKDLFLGNSLDISYEKNFGQTYTPAQTVEKRNSGFTFTFDIGGLFTGVYGGVGGKGYTYKEEIANNNISSKAYGYMNYVKGRNNPAAMIDFNREKDGVFVKGTPAIASPVPTYDYFNVTAQTGSQQFRPFYSGNYVVFDKRNTNVSDNATLGLTAGGGSIFQIGGNINLTNGGSQTTKWVANNNFLSVAETNFNANALEEDVYIKQVGEKTLTDEVYMPKIGGERANQVVINQPGSGSQAVSYPVYKYRGNTQENISSPLKRTTREKRVAGFSYLTADQAKNYGLDKMINGEPRINTFRKAHHLSQINVTDNEGKRMIYGIPVYNKVQNDITFAVKKATNYEQARKSGVYNYTPGVDDKVGNANGRDNYYSKEDVPAYATTFLLTGILSPDYVDKTGNGISDDDPGTAVKFNYTKLSNDFKWRAPFGLNKANYNEGFISDHLDDKASISYGEKEIWYLQSVESKTMIAIFETSNRDDGLGVTNEQGVINTSNLLKKLDKITLYSKADWIKNGTNATPVKIVRLTYDYSLWQGTPNVLGAAPSKGKLTLKKVTFEFGKSTRGITNPYEFEYDLLPVNSQVNQPEYTLMDPLEKGDQYTERQSDRWGAYKQGFYNRTKILGNGNLQPLLNNSEFPYVPQVNPATVIDERGIADRLASKWQLTRIKTPSSGVITVVYESDDYAWVQNRKAMQMCFIKGIENSGQATGLINADRLVIELPRPLTSSTPAERLTEFKEKYLSMGGGKYHESIFYKVLTNINNKPGKDEYVHGYAQVNLATTDFPDAATVRLGLTKIKPEKSDVFYNPIALGAWQMLQTDLPHYAFDNYDNLEVGDGEAAIRSIVQALTNYISELGKPFEKRAANKKFADWVNLDKSMVRLTNPYNIKIGGGARVKKVQISDDWDQMVSGATAAAYGQEYDYSIRDNAGNIIASSGVASYEPQIGNEENPFHEPVNYTEKVHWANDKYHYVEKPFCESYFPAASVGYSKVTVTSFGVSNEKQTGYIENEFYTAQEFPTFVEYMPLDARSYENNLTVRLFSSNSVDKMAVSQGFKVELNDMHGKPKLVRVYNKGGSLISSTEYKYNVKDDRAEAKELDNVVDVMATDGTYSKKSLGVDVDMTTDVRESVSSSSGDTFGASAGVTLIPPFPIFFIPPIPIPIAAPNYHHTSFISAYHSISAVKVVHKYGIITKVITTQNGSTVEAENLVWDGETGEVLLTKTQNEYDRYTYAFNYPAHYVVDYEGMGAAYKNLGTTFTSFTTGADGKITSLNDAEEKAYLFPGDELVFLGQTEKRGWIIKGPQSGTTVPDYRLIDQKGEFIVASGTWLLLRSGRRNLLTGAVGSVVTMKDPRVGGQIILDLGKNVLDSKAIEFKDEWAVPVNKISNSYSGPDTTCANTLCTGNLFNSAIKKIIEQNGTYTRRGLFAWNTDNLTVADMIYMGGDCFHNPCMCSFYNNQPPAAFPYFMQNQRYNSGTNQFYINPGDAASIGGYNIVFDYIHPDFINLVNSSMSESAMATELNANMCSWTGPMEGYDPQITFVAYMNKYCLINESGCDYVFRRTNSCNVPNGTLIRGSCIDYQNFYGAYATFTDLVTFHLVTPPIQINSCDDPVNQKINPYYTGIKGNWRPLMNHVYTVNREQKPGNPAQTGGTDIRSTGYYKSYTPFWTFQGVSMGTAGLVKTGSSDTRWVWSNSSVYYDQKGNEIESVDALGRYGSALFGYKQSVATAVAANARNNEIAFDGFEDYDFDLETVNNEPCPLNRHLDFGLVNQSNVWTGPGGSISLEESHTGKSSYKLNGTTNITKQAGNAQPPSTPLLFYDGPGHYLLGSNELANGFAPVNGRNYIFSCWVFDGSPTTNSLSGVSITVNGVSPTAITVVEGWKRVEIPFIASSSFVLEMSGSAKYVDDIRIFPNAGQMNSYVYDNRTMRLMAQLDENNFATLYEYDDEGTPVRVKKETEKGIMTLKENRQSLRKRN